METDRAHDTSAQSRQDALADAETLRLIVEDLTYDPLLEDNIPHLLYCADTRSPRGRNSLKTAIRKRPEAAVRMCRDAARAAFRACPGLRGEP